MPDSYVCSGAMMKCTMGTAPAKLTVLPTRTIYLAGQPQANISDHQTMVNLAPFGLCRSLGFPPTASATAAAHGHLTPMPCMHNTPAPWMGGKMDYLVKGQPALLKSCKCQCMWGGTISLVTDGQVGEGTQYVQKKPKEIWNHVPASNTNQGVVVNRSTNSKSDSFLDKLSNLVDNAKWWWQHKKYIKKITKEKYEYKPEAIDVTLSTTLRGKLKEIKAEQVLTSTKEMEDRMRFVENTLVPSITEAMDLDNNFSFKWYESNVGSLGYYSEGKRSLNINKNVLNSTDEKEIKILINTIVHECKHAQQYDEITKRKNHGYSEKLIKKWEENMNNYISPDESDEGYMKQPVELDAWEFADSVIPDGLLDSYKENNRT